VPIMALSATCPPKVLDDLVEVLRLEKPVVSGEGALVSLLASSSLVFSSSFSSFASSPRHFLVYVSALRPSLSLLIARCSLLTHPPPLSSRRPD
jgi:superfamily II DNA helicase RecQ